MAKHYKINEIKGFQKIITPESSDLKLLNFSIIKNLENEEFSGNTEDEEAVFVITEGECKFFYEGKLLGEMKRKNVFDEPPVAVYLPPYSNYSIKFNQMSEICIVSSKAKGKGKAKIIFSKDMKFRRVGEETFFRNIIDIIGEDFPAEKIILGETINDPGNWSSYPPHKHDRDNPPEEVKLEELYFFKLKPKTGFGFIRIFDEEEDNIFLLKNNELVTIPKGYHPVAVAPKHQIYYLWALAGNVRKLQPYTHPDYIFKKE